MAVSTYVDQELQQSFAIHPNDTSTLTFENVVRQKNTLYQSNKFGTKEPNKKNNECFMSMPSTHAQYLIISSKITYSLPSVEWVGLPQLSLMVRHHIYKKDLLLFKLALPTTCTTCHPVLTTFFISIGESTDKRVHTALTAQVCWQHL